MGHQRFEATASRPLEHPPFFKRHPFLGTLLGYPDSGWHRHLRLDPTYDTALARMQLAIGAVMLVAAAVYVVVKATSWLTAP